MNIHYFISGVVHKLKHHLGDFGSTGAMCCTGDLLACAGYDLDNGLAYINCEYKLTTKIEHVLYSCLKIIITAL